MAKIAWNCIIHPLAPGWKRSLWELWPNLDLNLWWIGTFCLPVFIVFTCFFTAQKVVNRSSAVRCSIWKSAWWSNRVHDTFRGTWWTQVTGLLRGASLGSPLKALPAHPAPVPGRRRCPSQSCILPWWIWENSWTPASLIPFHAAVNSFSLESASQRRQVKLSESSQKCRVSVWIGKRRYCFGPRPPPVWPPHGRMTTWNSWICWVGVLLFISHN